MGAAVPQVITSDRASNNQFIDGSLKFDQSASQHLTRTFTGGNRRTWTHSSWVRQGDFGRKKSFFMVGPSSGLSAANYLSLDFDDNDKLRYAGGAENYKVTSQRFRDTGWYHVVWTCDTTQEAAVDRTKIYVNGELITVWSTSSSNPTQNYELPYNENSVVHRIGTSTPYNNDREWNDAMSQVYFIDGAALGPENFGFTDALTNTWKPKKYKHDKRFYGVTFSNQLSPSDGPWRNSNPKSNGFDGSAGTSIALDTIEGTLTFSPNFGQGPFEIEYKGFNDGQTTATIDGTTLTYSGSNSIWTGTVGSFNTMTMVAAANNRPGITYIKVNGYMLVDAAADNSFYLPFDGKTPIGEDRIGNGNNWTPINFGGSVALDNPQVSGARPILNTTQGGSQAGVGVFGSLESKFYTVTTANGSVYQFDITSGNNPSLEFIRGATYRFDYTSHASHPLRFSSTNPDSSTTAYTTGTNTSVSNVITITVPHDAPDTLYYYCTAHASAMNGAISVTTDNTKADQYAANCVLALPLVGTKEDTSVSIACTSSTKSVSSSGNVAFSKDQSNLYSGSFEFDGTDDYLDATITALGTRDFTVEFWCYTTDTQSHQTLLEYGDHTSNGFWISYRTGTGITVRGDINVDISNATYGSPAQTTPKEKWHHIALTRESNTAKLFINGRYIGNCTWSQNYSATNLRLGHATYGPGSAEDLTGYIQDVRLYDGAVKYTGTTVNEQSFVVPSRSPDILPDTPSGVRGSSKLAKITDGAVSFEGTATSKLTVADSSDFTFGTNDFCIEFYYYNNSLDGTYNIIFDCMGSNRSGIQLAFETDGDYRIEVGDGSNNWIWQSTGFDAKANKWTHFALTREGSTFRAFEDGVLLGTQTSSTAVGDPRSLAIGGYASDDSTNYGFDGFISNFRIVNGSAVYTASFAPPTAPLTNITNTKLLTCQTATTYQIATVAPLVSGVNNGTVWSSSLTANSLFRSSSYPAKDAFNGVTKTSTEDCAATPQTAGQGFTFTFGGGVPFTTLQMQCDHNNGATVTANGVNITSQLSSGSLTNTTITGVSSPLTSLSVVSHNGDAGYLGSVTIDGTMLVDPVAPTDAVSTNFNSFITDINTVRGQESGYATFNPQDFGNSAGSTTLSDGNLKVAFPSDSGTGQAAASLFVSSGKWYCEFYLESVNDLTSVQYGLVSPGSTRNTYIGHSNTLDQYGWEPEIDRAYNNGTNTTPTGKTFTSQWSVAAMALDLDAGTWEMFIDGIPTGTIYSGIKGTYTFAIGDSMSSGYHTHTANFGQKPFKFSPPDGFQPLNTANLRPDKVISRPDKYVGIVTYTGTGTTPQSISGLNFDDKPDVVWIKDYTSSSNYSYRIADSVRGSTKVLFTNATNGTQTNEYGTIDKFTFNGFDLRQGSNNNGDGSNTNGSGLVAWCFKAGGKIGSNAYNIDDEGYATAAAANMSVGILTTSEYNQTQNWTNNIASATNISSGVEARLFNGILYGTNADIQSTQGSSGVITFTTPITGSRIEIYTLGNVGEIGVNGFDLPISAYTWTDTNVTKLTSVSTRHPGAGQIQNLIAIRVDGKMLVDSGITLNAPSIAPTACSVGTKQGFSIIQYTGTDNTYDTIPHGLTQAPDFALFKNTSQDGDDWIIYNSSLSAQKRLKLNSANAADSQGDQFNNTDPTSNVFTIGTYDNINKDGDSYIAYLWHNVPGLQKFGVYKGADVNSGVGHFVECGFRPALLIVKKHDGTDGGVIMDSEVMKFNPMRRQLRPNETGPYSAEYDSFAVDFYANGFRVIGNTGQMNEYNKNFIFAAWASAPAIDMFGGGGNAR